MIRQGEVYDWSPPVGGMRRVVVLSDDAYNQHAWPVCAAIVRGGDPSLYLVAVADADPTGGRVMLGSIGAIPPDELGPDPVGMLTGQTWEAIRGGLRELFGL